MGCASSRSTQVASSTAPRTAANKPRVLVAFYSTYGHSYLMAKAAVEGALSTGAHVDLRRVQEVLPDEVLEKMQALEAQKAFADVPLADIAELGSYDAIIFVTSTRFATMATGMRTFLDGAGGLWLQGQLIGKVGSAMISTATQHGGQEKSFLAFRNFFLHHGMILVGLPPNFPGFTVDAMEGCSYYGASTIVGPQGARMPSERELDGARFQAKHVAEIAAKLVA